MMEKNTIGFIVILLFITCNRMEAPGKEKQFENKSYVRLFFSNEKECMDSQPPDFFINCHQQLSFYEDNRAEIMLTDVIWIGTYRVEDKKIIIEMEPNFEVPDGELIFEVRNNNILIRSADRSHWKKMKGNSIWNN